MKKNDLTEIKGLDEKALVERVSKIRSEISNLIIDKNTNKLKDLKSIFKQRKDLARVLTVLKQKELLRSLESKKEEK